MPKINVPLAVSVGVGSRAPKKRAPNKQSMHMQMLSQQWHSGSFEMQSAWNNVNNILQNPSAPFQRTQKGPSGWTAFFACNSALTTARKPITLWPLPVSKPKALPFFTIKATGSGPSTVIMLVPEQAIPAGSTLVLWGTPVTADGNGSQWTPKVYRVLGNIEGGIPTEGVDVTGLYLGVFPRIPSSVRIGFKLMAVTDGGYSSNTVSAWGATPPVGATFAVGRVPQGGERED